jgi:hypothetical protein
VKAGEIKSAENSVLAHQKDPKLHVARPGDGARPQPGYIIVLGARGGDVVGADRNAAAADAQKADATKTEDSAEKAFTDAKQKADAAQVALAAVKAADKSDVGDIATKKKAYEAAQNALSVATLTVKRAKSKLDDTGKAVDVTHAKLERARNDDVQYRDKVREKYGNIVLNFQHVCFLADAVKQIEGAKEEWTVFGGGQKVQRDGVEHEGSAKSKAIYDPSTNELSAADNRSGANWVHGWINPDDLAEK